MDTITARPIYYTRDLAKISDLLLAWRLTQDLHLYPTLWRVRLFLTSRVWNPALDACFWESPSEQTVGLAMLWRRRSNSDYLVLEVFPHPDSTTEELLAEMLRWGEKRTREIAAEQDIPLTLFVINYAGQASLGELLDQWGFILVPPNPEGHNLYLSRPLQGVIPEPSLMHGYTLRSLTMEDDLEAYQALSSFATVNPFFLREQLASDEYRHLVIQDLSGAFAAYCECSICHGEWQPGQPRLGWIDYMETRADLQRQGLGQAALLAGLRQLQEWGAKTAMLVTISTNTPAVGLYQKTGFTPYEGIEPLVYKLQMNQV
jgi:ribosomal protein S18 acetylase RimI-like enzyme